MSSIESARILSTKNLTSAPATKALPAPSNTIVDTDSSELTKEIVVGWLENNLDVDALKIVSDGVNAQRSDDNAIVVITHYQRLLDYIVPDFVHILSEGVIIKSGGPELALEVEKNGYAGMINAA